MNDIAKIATQIAPQIAPRVTTPEVRPVQPVQRQPRPGPEIEGTPQRVNAGGFKDTPEQTAALIRLDRAIASEQPPRTDVPRGYYLDIVV